MMDNSYDHWFSKYDQESFDKDFFKVPYYDFLNQLIVNPDFNLLPNEPQLSLDNVHKVLQQTLQKNHLIISTFILPLLDNSKEPFLRWVRSVIAFIDCEKIYSIMFWNLNFIPNFLEYRLYASFIRLYKFLISLNQNVIQPKSLATEQIRLSNKFTIKTLAERYQDALYVSFDELAKLQGQMLKVLKPLVSQNPTLIGKIYYFIYHMYDKPTLQLLKDLDQQFGQLENQWVKKILAENELAKKYIDAYLNDDKQGGDQFEFEDSEILKQLMTSNKQESLYKVDVQDKSLLEKSKKTQFLNSLETKAKRRNYDGKSSVFVQNYSAISESTKSSTENRSKIYSEESNITTEQYTFIQYSNNNLQNSVVGFLASDLIQLEKEHQQEFKNSKLHKTFQNEESIKLNDDLVEFITKADAQISVIKDEDILLGDNYTRKRQRIKNNKNVEENESPDVHRKQTMVNSKQQEIHEEELRKLRARRLLAEQNQFHSEKYRYTSNQDNQLTTDKDYLSKQYHTNLGYSFEDSMSEDDESEDDIKLKSQQDKVIIPQDQSLNTQGIIFEKFQQYSGLSIQRGSEKNKYFLNRLFHMNENSLRISGKSLVLDFEERKWEFLKQSILPQNLIKEECSLFIKFVVPTKHFLDRQCLCILFLKSKSVIYYNF
ncbi:unnamed protein product (macronuclear) [Paramecium tetraurelia]|uniref:BSD domain-containing protein n=1 Tax=Paramecium tetraurelia TaxID=5888 RepID=A0BS88_PARTE|nr:uncharacterized protein GSPATT00031636001 [Paramecium tetraurelia]CAK61405.1 unnamed protein product [Paramecium tetraurelia]|eukprot:XP_001428803.1 hypothetical protein (macronuclear) [Paramecium tetraurelia strain d4-2]